MSEFKGTPGPWKAVKAAHGPIDIFDQRGRDVVTVYGGGVEAESKSANANLIAAAPELLECLIELRQWISQEIAHPNSPCGRADTAIAKALGAEK